MRESELVMDTLMPLGNFSKLPIELRLQIWEELFSDINMALEGQEQPSKNRLSILCCNSYLYEELSSHLYRGLKHIIRIDSSYSKTCYLEVGLYSKRFTRALRLKDSIALRDHLLNFPHSKVELQTLYIKISHRRQRISRFINLWLKINDLIHILRNMNSMVKLHVQLSNQWPAKNQFFRGTYCCYDYDFAIIPFFKLHGWTYELPTIVQHRISQESDEKAHSMLYRIQQEGQGKICYDYLQIDTWVVCMRYLLDISLDKASGRTASLLRRDRFINWFSADGSSSYEERFLSDLEGNYKHLLRWNDMLQRIITRRSSLLALYGAVKEKGIEEFEDNFRIWSAEEWLSKYPKGLQSLTYSFNRYYHSLDQEYMRLNQKISSMDQSPLAEFSEDLHWWSSHAVALFSETEFPCSFFNCSLCVKHKVPCRWCKKYDYRKRCGFCREGMMKRTTYLFQTPNWHCPDPEPYPSDCSDSDWENSRTYRQWAARRREYLKKRDEADRIRKAGLVKMDL